MQLTTADNAQGIVSKHLIDIDAELIYQAAKVGPHRLAKSKPVEHKSDFLLLPPSPSFKLKSSIRLEPDRYGQYVEGVDTFSGTVNGDENKTFVLSLESNQMQGQVRLGGYLLRFKYENGIDSHVLSITDLRLMPKDTKETEVMRQLTTISKRVLGSGAAGGTNQTMMSSAGLGNIRILFYHTPAVAARNNMNAMVANILSELNTSIDLSRINPDVDFFAAGVMDLGDDLHGVCRWEDVRLGDTIVRMMQNRLVPFNNLENDLSSTHADVALAIVTTDSGIFYRSCRPFPNTRLGGVAADIFVSGQPIAMTTDTYALGDLTALHELGHVFGGNHEIAQSVFLFGDGTPPYARGLVNNTGEWQTIMGGYADENCSFNPGSQPHNQSCERLNRWSNPAITYQGQFTGIASESDMESALEFTAPIVSGWTSYPNPTPSVMPALTINSMQCFGFNRLLWPLVGNATHYQLFESTTASFNGGESRISVSAVAGQSINVPYNSTRYYRVRACNGNGCGSYSSIKSATYYSGCP